MSNILSFKAECNRKIIHTTSIFFPILYIFLNKDIMLYIMFISTAITLFIDYNRNKNNYISNIFNKVLGHVVRKHEKIKPMSASYLMFISTILILLIPENMKSIAILSISYCSISDSVAAIYGMRYGRLEIINNKTLEGMFAFIVSGIILTFLFITTSVLIIDGNLFLIIIAPFLLSFVELISPMEYDNISVPIISSLYLFIIF